MIVCLSSEADHTMRYYTDYLLKRGIAFHHLYWETLDAATNLGLLVEQLTLGVPFFVREPAVSDFSERARMLAVYSWLRRSKVRSIWPSIMSTNWSKWLHYLALESVSMQLGASTSVPNTAVQIADVDLPNVVYKTISNIPSRVTSSCASLAEYAGLDERPYPKLRQAYVVGDNIRAHVIGDKIVSTQLIHEPALDYRDKPFRAVTVPLPSQVEKLLLMCASKEGAIFAGIDLIAQGGRYWLLEVNPMPGYHSFEAALMDESHPISSKITEYLLKKENS